MEANYEEHPHGEGGHEKKPVLKKVKDKVKKIKDTISKKTHGHHGDDHHEGEVSEEEEVYEEEIEADPEVHGAPLYESEAGRHFVGGQDENLDSGPGLVTPAEVVSATAVKDPSAPVGTGVSVASDDSQLLHPAAVDTGVGVGERRNLIRDRDENIDPEKVALRAMAGSAEEDPSAPMDMTSTPAGATQPCHPYYSPPMGGDEVGESPLLSSFEAMAVSDKPVRSGGVQELPPTPIGTNDQLISPDPPQQDAPIEGREEQKSSSYTDKISSTATAAKDAAISAAIGSTEYGKKMVSTVYDKVSEAGTAIMGKGTTEGEKSNDTKTVQPDRGALDKGVSVKEYVVRKLRPGDEDRALSEVISEAIHAKKQEAAVVGTAKAKGPGEESGSRKAKESGEESGSGKGMVGKIKGAVTSWIGAGSTPGAVRGAPTATDHTDIKGEEAVTGH